jgi:UDP-N-acetyl-D-galactosamine dehydrogenase
VLAKNSGLYYATETMPAGSQVFYLGYSPERINPGDKAHRVTDIVKVTSGSTPEIATLIDDLYASIITAGTFRAANIRVAEAAKVIENTQRDVNIALINELAVIFEKIGIDTESVLTAAGTKWNFLPFRPGLVGGHCIGVDPYYLTHKAQQLGHNPEMILAGRRINDTMSAHVADRVIKLMLRREINPLDARVLVLGLTFKENCPDTRNSKVMDLINSLSEYKCRVDVYDPQIDPDHMSENFNGTIVAQPNNGAYDAILLAVAHDEFVQMGTGQLRRYGKTNHVLFDLKYAFPETETDERL